MGRTRTLVSEDRDQLICQLGKPGDALVVGHLGDLGERFCLHGKEGYLRLQVVVAWSDPDVTGLDLVMERVDRVDRFDRRDTAVS